MQIQNEKEKRLGRTYIIAIISCKRRIWIRVSDSVKFECNQLKKLTINALHLKSFKLLRSKIGGLKTWCVFKAAQCIYQLE